MNWARCLGAGLLVAILAGCSSTTAENSAGPASGVIVGLGVSGVTADPLIAYAAGVGAEAAVEALQKTLTRRVHHGEQQNISDVVATLQPGQSAPWKISYRLPFLLNEHGDVTVTQILHTPFTTCRQAAFSIIAGQKPEAARAIYVTSMCQDSSGVWRWAEAEPATARWGFLQ